jgi:hypothetical protein
MKNLLYEGDKILRVQTSGGMSKLISWKLCVKSSEGLKWQLESSDDQTYVVQSSNLFNPMIEGK